MIKAISREELKIIRKRFERLYGGQAEKLLERFVMVIGRYGVGVDVGGVVEKWNERDSVLITYADTVRDGEHRRPLAALNAFSRKHLKGAIRTIHLLPFYPWSSDDGFSVIDYRKVDPVCGEWADVVALGQNFDLMFDLVLNHCSAKSSWFKDYVAGIEPGRHYFLEMDPKLDYREVVRPRTTPLLTKTRTRDGESHVWTTFSPDQVDLNWQNPEVFFEFLDILFLYLSKGMRIARLDAVAFLWKELGTNCLHLPETHEMVKLFRDVCDIVAPKAIILTETNVPHAENLSYFGDGDEAHMVYQFSLPPLLLHAFTSGNGKYLTKWAMELEPPPEGCTFFNFTASHDGVGMRPVEGILPTGERDRLIEHVEAAGGRVGWRAMPDGSRQPYELNITYYSALAIPDDTRLGAARYLCSQALALSMRGIPGIYFHSLTATENDEEGLESSGANRSINRRKWELPELKEHLKAGVGKLVFNRYLRMLRRRTEHPAFHPDAPQEVFDVHPDLFVHRRTSLDGEESVFCVFNLTAKNKQVKQLCLDPKFTEAAVFYDILRAREVKPNGKGFTIKPYQALWLVPRG
ncbi:MAG TPA: sugar phosphorylase [Opitutales bacterium]|nr:sugar phosphorylase [Opitutales bacterium]